MQNLANTAAFPWCLLEPMRCQYSIDEMLLVYERYIALNVNHSFYLSRSNFNSYIYIGSVIQVEGPHLN